MIVDSAWFFIFCYVCICCGIFNQISFKINMKNLNETFKKYSCLKLIFDLTNNLSVQNTQLNFRRRALYWRVYSQRRTHPYWKYVKSDQK